MPAYCSSPVLEGLIVDMTADISQFVDIHTHILPGIDDGPKNLSDSLAMAKAYVEVGISRLIATPHFIPGTAWAAGHDRIAIKLMELQKYLLENEIVLEIFPGMEIAYHQKLLDKLDKGLLQPLASSKTYLLEPSFNDSPSDLLGCVRQMLDSGHRVILAHPERIPSFQETIEPLVKLLKQGLQIQLNIGSLLNKFGESSKQLAMRLIDDEVVHYLASDAHSTKNRRPVTAADWKTLNGLLGDELLTRLCVTNPSLLLEDY